MGSRKVRVYRHDARVRFYARDAWFTYELDADGLGITVRRVADGSLKQAELGSLRPEELAPVLALGCDGWWASALTPDAIRCLEAYGVSEGQLARIGAGELPMSLDVPTSTVNIGAREFGVSEFHAHLLRRELRHAASDED